MVQLSDQEACKEEGEVNAEDGIQVGKVIDVKEGGEVKNELSRIENATLEDFELRATLGEHSSRAAWPASQL